MDYTKLALYALVGAFIGAFFEAAREYFMNRRYTGEGKSKFIVLYDNKIIFSVALAGALIGAGISIWMQQGEQKMSFKLSDKTLMEFKKYANKRYRMDTGDNVPLTCGY